MKKILPVFLTSVILLVAVLNFSAVSVNAQTTTNNQTFSIPPTSEGPGFILPDSPFYFLDKLKQSVRLAFAVTPSQKAEVYSSVAGERVGELRFELIKNNIPAAEIAIIGIRENTMYAAQEVADAKLWGADVTALAGDINQKIKEHLQILDALGIQATGGLKAETTVAIASLIDSKTKVDSFLSKAEQDSELKSDLENATIRSAQNTLNDAAELKNNLILLQKQQTNQVATKAKTTKQSNSAALETTKALTDVDSVVGKAQSIVDTISSILKINSSTPTPTPKK